MVKINNRNASNGTERRIAEEIRYSVYNYGTTVKDLCERYKYTRATVLNILAGKTHKKPPVDNYGWIRVSDRRNVIKDGVAYFLFRVGVPGKTIAKLLNETKHRVSTRANSKPETYAKQIPIQIKEWLGKCPVDTEGREVRGSFLATQISEDEVAICRPRGDFIQFVKLKDLVGCVDLDIEAMNKAIWESKNT